MGDGNFSLSHLLLEHREQKNYAATTEEEDVKNDVLTLSQLLKAKSEFKITVNGVIINSKLSKSLRSKYFELCYCRGSSLHDGLPRGINQTLATGIITETIKIAEAIKGSKISTPLDDIAAWDKNLESFELLGMDVGFLRSRLNRLMGLVIMSTNEVDSKRCEEACSEMNRVKEEFRALEVKLLEASQAIWELEKEIESLNEKTGRYEITYEQEANAPW